MPKPLGKRGSWFAEWKGESYPCVHQCWFKHVNGQAIYDDPGVNNDAKWGPFVDAIRAKKTVILTEDEIAENGHPLDRKSYIAMFEVDKIEFTPTRLTFEFKKRVLEFR